MEKPEKELQNEFQNELQKDILAVLITEEEIKARVKELGQHISDFYRSQQVSEIMVVGVLRGSTVFLSDLIRAMDIPVKMDFIDAVSYGKSTVSSGTVRIMKDLSDDICDKHVLIVEDIIDTGKTLQCLLNMLWARKPKSLHLCAFLNKPSRRQASLNPDFSGVDIPDEFVVGYGLDYAGLYRQFPYVAVLKPEIYNKN